MPDQSNAATEHALLQEITAPLEQLPDDPLTLVDVEFPTVMRGYDRHAVDEYVQRTRRLVAELHSTRSPEAAVRRALERVGDQVAGILQRAHETSEQITARSRSEAEDRMEDARREAAAILAGAEQRVRELDADTDRIWAERQRIVADADDLSAQLAALAREAGERFAEAGSEAPEDEAELEAVEPGIDRTVAYTPLALDDPQEPVADDDSLEDDEITGAWDPTNPALDVSAAEADDDSDDPDEQATRVIPPASDAARHLDEDQ